MGDLLLKYEKLCQRKEAVTSLFSRLPANEMPISIEL